MDSKVISRTCREIAWSFRNFVQYDWLDVILVPTLHFLRQLHYMQANDLKKC